MNEKYKFDSATKTDDRNLFRNCVTAARQEGVAEVLISRNDIFHLHSSEIRARKASRCQTENLKNFSKR